MRPLYFFLLLFILFNAENILSQDIELTDSSFMKVPELSELIEAALIHSPLLKARIKETEALRQEVIIDKKKWMDYIYLDGAGNYGMFDQVIIRGLHNEASSSLGLISRSEQIRYYGGVSVKIPLSALMSRNNNIRHKELIAESSEYLALQVQSNIRQIVIEEYYQLKYLEESVKTFLNIYETLNISYLNAKQELQQGRMDLNNFAILVSTVGKAKDDYLNAKNNYYAQYRMLQDLAGIGF